MAKTLKLIELTPTPWDGRWTVLKNEIKEKYDVTLDVQIRPTTPEQLKEAVQEVLKSPADICRLDDRFVSEVLQYLPATTFGVSLSGSAGLLIKENGKWWPKPVFDVAFTRSVAAKIGQVDLSSAALVIGAGGSAKLVISSLIKLGFSTLNIADGDPVKGRSTVESLRKRYFDVKFDFIPTQNLTTLPGIHSIVVNTNPLDEKDDLYAELYFFNFLKTGGTVVDLTLVPSRTPLIIEAEQWGARYLEGDSIAADRDEVMLEHALGLKLNVEEYRLKLRAVIDAVPFDPGPYLKRFRERAL